MAAGEIDRIEIGRIERVGPSGMGAYHGIEGFRAMSHAKGVFVQGRWALPNLLRAPFGKLADFSLAALLGPSRQPAGGRVEWDAKR